MAIIFSAKKDLERNPNPPSKKKLKQSKCGMKKKLRTKIPTEKNNRAICYTPDTPKTPAMERAERIQDKLALDSISLVRDMRISNVSGGFWLGLQSTFCCEHLPKYDEMIDLVVEGLDEKEWPNKYLANKHGLSAGWKRFSVAHGLLEDDVLVFELIEPLKFKVHIVRRSSEDNAVHVAPSDQPKMMTSATMHEEIATKKSLVHFEGVKCLKDFEIQVNGSFLGSKIPKEVMKKYYNLCKSQNKFLHENLVEGFDSEEAARVISGTVDIADAIVEAKAFTDLDTYRDALESFEGLGMAVGFLRVKIEKVSVHVHELEIKERERRDIETRLSDLSISIMKHTRECRLVYNKFRVVFSKTAGAPWTK